MKTLFLVSTALMSAALAGAQPQVVTVPGNSPVVTFRIVFRTGAAADPGPTLVTTAVPGPDAAGAAEAEAACPWVAPSG